MNITVSVIIEGAKETRMDIFLNLLWKVYKQAFNFSKLLVYFLICKDYVIL